MVKRSSKKKGEHDFSVRAFRVVQEATSEPSEILAIEEQLIDTDGKNPNAVALGRLGGKKGGKARAAKLTPEQRRDIAQKAARTRWERLKQERHNEM
ncbi:MAG: hypothetical protein HYU29_00055 [Chloroflexi bacterium]|nr:hypothetical protein [Chloroflexota bacterium]